ncbi:hypothetical protein HUS23_09115 [Ectothiorhodospiraceae bacterium 2226]|nr:hypothetical protein HUS23_09115 [Ectothiorhodospiraceae bacterium 2226]
MRRNALPLGLMLALLPPATLSAAEPGTVSVGGDARGGYFSRERDDRDGASSDDSDWRVRLRAGVTWQATEALSTNARFAGRYSTHDTNNEHFEFFTTIPADDGLRFGDSTLDELYLRYQPSARWDLKLGRMQTKFELEGVAKKSLSRNDSPSTDITWTDGLHLRYTDLGGWDYHAILQYSEAEGPTTVRRAPLAFTDAASRATYYIGMEHKDPEGLLLQRGWDITYIPQALHSEGVGAGPTDDYVALSGRLALQWPLTHGMRFVWAGEAGYAPTRPTEAAIGLPGVGDASGTAWQTSVNLMDLAPGHNIGVVYGQVGGGWLLSPDFGNNQELLEARYQWRLSKTQSFEARIRGRRDLERHATALRKREDTDYYLRYTLTF